MTQVWLSAAGLCGATLIGAILGFGIKELPHKWNDTVMGFCAGVMLAASVLGLIVPAAEQAGSGHWWLVAIGVIVGAMFLNLLDFVTPHMHHITGLDPEQHTNNSSLSRIMLFVMAIALHKLPEGIAAGVGFNSADTTDAWTVSLGIALQNIPEGMVIISPLLLAGVSKTRTLIISLTIAMLEVIGVWIGYAAGGISERMLPVMLAFAGGAMLYVVSDEMIPETHAHGYQKQATYALLIGFMTLMFIEAQI
jgi:ZIP family zinc transporter